MQECKSGDDKVTALKLSMSCSTKFSTLISCNMQECKSGDDEVTALKSSMSSSTKFSTQISHAIEVSNTVCTFQPCFYKTSSQHMDEFHSCFTAIVHSKDGN